MIDQQYWNFGICASEAKINSMKLLLFVSHNPKYEVAKLSTLYGFQSYITYKQNLHASLWKEFFFEFGFIKQILYNVLTI